MSSLLSIVSAALLCLCACDATEGALVSRRAARDAGDMQAQPDAGVVQAGMSLQYQITGSVDTGVDADMFVVDLFDASAQSVAKLHAAGRVVIAYVSVGSFEPWREDAGSFARTAIGDALAGYPDESWLDIRSADVRARIEARFDRARDKGFDGVFASTLGGYKETTGFPLTQADELDYVRFLASAARTRGLSAGVSGDFELGDGVAGRFDWALSIGCIARADCDALDAFVMHGKPVFDLETDGDRTTVCNQATTYGIATTIKHPSFDAWRVPCP